MDLKRLVVAPLYAEVRAHCSHINVYCKEGTFVVLSSTTHDSFLPSFLPSFITHLESSSNKMKFKSLRLSSILYYQCVTKIKQP